MSLADFMRSVRLFPWPTTIKEVPPEQRIPFYRLLVHAPAKSDERIGALEKRADEFWTDLEHFQLDLERHEAALLAPILEDLCGPMGRVPDDRKVPNLRWIAQIDAQTRTEHQWPPYASQAELMAGVDETPVRTPAWEKAAQAHGHYGCDGRYRWWSPPKVNK